MKKQLITESLKIEEEYALNIETLKAQEENLRLRLKDLIDGKNDPAYLSLLKDMKNTKNMLLGFLFLRKELKCSLRIARKPGINKDAAMEAIILRNLVVNKVEIEKAHAKYRKYLRERNEYILKIGQEKRALEELIKETNKGASEFTEEAFTKELVRIFRSNEFGKMYDTKDEYLGYSIGQIFIIKYALNNLVQYLDQEDISFNMQMIIKLLGNYEFKCDGRVKSYRDFVAALKEGNIYMCNFSKTSLSYRQALYLYKHVCNTFHLPRVVAYGLRRKLK